MTAGTDDYGHGLRWRPRLRKPKPVTPPPPRSVFESRGVLTTYGMVNGDLRAADVCDKAKANGYAYVAGQYDLGNLSHLPELGIHCHARGLLFGIWDATPEPGRVATIATYRPDLLILESEGASTDWAGIAQVVPHVPWAVVTNLSGLDDKTLQAAGAALLVECYVEDNPNATTARMVAAGKQRGYQTVVPVPGVYHSKPLSDYLPLDSFCVYAAEYMTAADWAAR